jgi:hypothetical protein
LGSVVHLTTALDDLVTVASPAAQRERVLPVLVGPDSTGVRDCSDLDGMLRSCVVVTAPTVPLPYDASALARLEQGERATGRLGRTLLLRGARRLAVALQPNRAWAST